MAQIKYHPNIQTSVRRLGSPGLPLWAIQKDHFLKILAPMFSNANRCGTTLHAPSSLRRSCTFEIGGAVRESAMTSPNRAHRATSRSDIPGFGNRPRRRSRLPVSIHATMVMALTRLNARSVSAICPTRCALAARRRFLTLSWARTHMFRHATIVTTGLLFKSARPGSDWRKDETGIDGAKYQT